MTEETKETMCENVIQTMINYMKNYQTLDKSELMTRFDITYEQYKNCLDNALDRFNQPNQEKKDCVKLTSIPNSK